MTSSPTSCRCPFTPLAWLWPFAILSGAGAFVRRVAFFGLSLDDKEVVKMTLGDGERVRARRVDMDRVWRLGLELAFECACECELRLKASAAGMFIASSTCASSYRGRSCSFISSASLDTVKAENGEGRKKGDDAERSRATRKTVNVILLPSAKHMQICAA